MNLTEHHRTPKFGVFYFYRNLYPCSRKHALFLILTLILNIPEEINKKMALFSFLLSSLPFSLENL